MFNNRLTTNIPYNENAIANVLYGNGISAPSSFVQPKEITQKSSTGKDYSKRKPDIDYKSFGKRIKF